MKTKAARVRGQWDDGYYVRSHELSRQGLAVAEIAAALGVPHTTYRRWLGQRPALRDAIKRGRGKNVREYMQRRNAGETLVDYVYLRLPPDLKELWNQIHEVDGHKSAEKIIESLLKNRGQNTIKHLWFHALAASNFNGSEACRKINIPITTPQQWIENDPEFGRLVEAFLTVKKDFVEGGLMRLIEEGDASATIFANKTLNADRGYAPTLRVKSEHSGEVAHLHQVADLDDIMSRLSVSAKREVLQAIQDRREGRPAPKMLESNHDRQ